MLKSGNMSQNSVLKLCWRAHGRYVVWACCPVLPCLEQLYRVSFLIWCISLRLAENMISGYCMQILPEKRVLVTRAMWVCNRQ